MVTICNKTTAYLKVARTVDLNNSSHKKKNFFVTMCGDGC